MIRLEKFGTKSKFTELEMANPKLEDMIDDRKADMEKALGYVLYNYLKSLDPRVNKLNFEFEDTEFKDNLEKNLVLGRYVTVYDNSNEIEVKSYE